LGIVTSLLHGLLDAAVAGSICSTGFLALVLYSVVRFRRSAKLDSPPFAPRVTLLKPLCGLEPRLDESLESFFAQDYPAFEIIFGARSSDDPAIRIVERLRAKYPSVPVEIVFSGEPRHPNAKVCSLAAMIAVATTDFYIISDSDVRVERNYIRELVAPFADPRIGLATCLYRGVPTGGLWSRLEALGMSVEMTAGVLVSDTLEGMKFALGPTMMVRRQALEQIGGIGALARYCADDYVLGNRVALAGWRVVLSRHTVDHVVLNRDFKHSILHQLRWMKSTRFSRPGGHLGTVLTFAMPFGLLGFLAGLDLHRLVLGAALLAWAVLNRLVLSIAAGWAAVRDSNSLKHCWLYPLRDLMGFLFWLASYQNSEVVWRGKRYRLHSGGEMTPVSAPSPPAAALPLASPPMRGIIHRQESQPGMD
jgi:ceramide glucosyltransferase